MCIWICICICVNRIMVVFRKMEVGRGHNWMSGQPALIPSPLLYIPASCRPSGLSGMKYRVADININYKVRFQFILWMAQKKITKTNRTSPNNKNILWMEKHDIKRGSTHSKQILQNSFYHCCYYCSYYDYSYHCSFSQYQSRRSRKYPRCSLLEN